LLQKVIDVYDIKREEVFLTNACLCRPADGTTPPKQAIAACRPRMLHELKDEGVETVVAMGNSAALGLLGTEGILALRVGPGRTSPYESLEGVRVIPTVHPAACLRQSDMFPSLVADVGKVVAPPPPWQEPDYRVIENKAEALRYFKRLKKLANAVVVDIECDIEKDIAFDHPDRYGMLCVGFYEPVMGAVVIAEELLTGEDDDDVWEAMAKTLRASKVIAHNGKFDLAGLYKYVGPIDLWFDTMLASYCLDERPGIHGLKVIAVEHLGAPRYDDEIDKYNPKANGYGVIPRDVLYRYNAYDVYATWLVYEMYRDRLERGKEPEWWSDFAHYEFKPLRETHDFLVEYGSNSLMYLELNGIGFDREYNRELMRTFQETLEPIEKEIDKILIEAGFHAINPRSPQQVKAALQYFRVKTDSTAADILERLMDILVSRNGDAAYLVPLYQFCDTLLKHRRQQKLYSTYVKGLARRVYRGRLYSSFLLHGSTTGRLASRNPNLQNIPRDTGKPNEPSIKQQFIPARKQNVFVQADYSQAELRVLSWLAQDQYFRAILSDPDRDLFDELTPILFPELPGKYETPEQLWKEARVRVKAFVYGLGYGRSEFGIAQEFKMAEEEARIIKNRFFETIPEIVDWQKRVRGHVKAGRDLITPFGRHRRFHLITQENWKDIQNEALAFLPQSTSSDVCLRAMARVRRDLRGSGAFVRNIVHDSILVDCPSDMATDVSKLLDQRMVESAQELVGDYVRFQTEVKIGPHWGAV